jgi:hypothetical membrane protein
MRVRRAWLAGVVASAPALVAAVTVATVRTPGYSSWRDTVSRLGSPGQPWAGFVRIAFVAYGLLILTGSRAVGDLQRCSRAFVALLRLYAVCAVVAGVAPKDMPGAPHTGTSQLHVLATLVGGAAVLAAMVLTATTDRSRLLRVLSVTAAVVTIVAAMTFRLTWGSRYYGAIERAVLVPAMAWLSAVAAASWRRSSETGHA